jgi:CheY-like chemotaxis protein
MSSPDPAWDLDTDPACMTQIIGNVLVVEDDPQTRELLETVLAAAGYHAVGAEDGLEAIHLLRSLRHRTPGVPCLVLLDLAMPRLGGSEFRRAQLGDPRVSPVPVAVMSGAPDLDRRALTLGAVAAIPKPVDVETLLAVVRRHCSGGGTTEIADLTPVADRLPHRRREHSA